MNNSRFLGPATPAHRWDAYGSRVEPTPTSVKTTHLEKLIELAKAHDAKKAEAFGAVVKEWTMEDIFPETN